MARTRRVIPTGVFKKSGKGRPLTKKRVIDTATKETAIGSLSPESPLPPCDCKYRPPSDSGTDLGKPGCHLPTGPDFEWMSIVKVGADLPEEPKVPSEDH